jgi:hypothetical protein
LRKGVCGFFASVLLACLRLSSSIVSQEMATTHFGVKTPPPTASPPTEHREAEFGASSISLEKDAALGLVGEHAREIDPEVEATVLRKIDLFLIPAMIVGTHLNPKPHTIRVDE